MRGLSPTMRGPQPPNRTTLIIVFVIASLMIQPSTALEPPKFSTKSPIEIEEKPNSDEPLEWYLLGLRGNTTLVHMRNADFLLFLRINVASIASTEYERVLVNSVSYTPSLLVNLTFTGPHNVSGLQKLSEHSDSLFILSYVPFHVTSFTSRGEILVPKPVTNRLSTPREEEALIYLGIGATVAFLLSAGTLVCVLLVLGARRAGRDKEPLLSTTSSFSGSRYQDPPQTIYSENFSQELAREKERLHQFTPIDDSLCPITDTEVDFTPRYLREDDSGSWLSEGSAAATVEVHSDQGCNGTVPSGYSPDGVMTTSDDGSSSIGMVDTMVGEGGGRDNDKISKSPFYWHNHAQENQDRDDQALVRPVCRHPPPAVAPKPHRRSRTPPRPPSRTDSLNPTSKSKGRPQSVVTRSPLPPLLAGRPLSVPAPNLTGSPIPSTTPSPSPLSQEEIDNHVSKVLTSLGLSQ